jgi:hypothetical protein
MGFRKAERRKAKLRLGITGPAGSGKTYGALLIAFGLGGKIAMIDTEHAMEAMLKIVEGRASRDWTEEDMEKLAAGL